ncbi:hypothetical protein Hanom_Chr01g00051531 [Helianthus anomalus]
MPATTTTTLVAEPGGSITPKVSSVPSLLFLFSQLSSLSLPGNHHPTSTSVTTNTTITGKNHHLRQPPPPPTKITTFSTCNRSGIYLPRSEG